ncbi:hypothetical protein ACQEXU_01735 [Vibrio sp. TRT 21S02]|uniref:hypothetical protein n=1 Tax=Vibrio sp. TRT 21S02 TaxID=3418507 RepID=UPI003CF396F3
MTQARTQTFSKHNILAQPTQPMNVADSTLSRWAHLSMQHQWILFTSECLRPDYAQLSASNVRCQNIIQMKPSLSHSEMEIAIKAIKSGNASAVVASNNIDYVNQELLRQLGEQYECEVFFVEGRETQYH